MKRKEVIIIVMTAFLAAIFSFILSGVLFGSPTKYSIKVPAVQKIDSNFPQPQTDNTYTIFYNKDALNPTQLIQIGGSNNTQPFQGSSQ